MFGCGLGGLVSMISPPGPRISGNGKHVHRDDPIVSWIDGGFEHQPAPVLHGVDAGLIDALRMQHSSPASAASL